MRIAYPLLLATGGAALLVSTSPAQASCDPELKASRTHFPSFSKARSQEGTVFLEVKVDESGRVSETQLLRSSGFDRLDRAAVASVRNRWVFDVSGCERKDLPATDLIAIEYRYESP